MSEEVNTTVWDDTLLVKFYDENVGLAREELARRLADSTNKREEENAAAEAVAAEDAPEDSPLSPGPMSFKVGDFARATYIDGLDYEGAVVSVDEKGENCTIRYLGYENEQVVPMENLLPSWGKKVRREQFFAAKQEEAGGEQPVRSKPSTSASAAAAANPKKSSSSSGKGKISAGGSAGLAMPPMPPLPPMFTSQNEGGEQDVVAMLTAWYMSGYYTGLYQGKKEANAMANAGAKKRTPKK